MLKISCIINSNVEDVIAFKCCNIFDQNLEIHIRNIGNKAVTINNFAILSNDNDSLRINSLYPPKKICIEPGDIAAYYSTMDPEKWKIYTKITMFDIFNNKYSLQI